MKIIEVVKKKNKSGNSKVVDKLCEEDSFNSCVINSFNY